MSSRELQVTSYLIVKRPCLSCSRNYLKALPSLGFLSLCLSFCWPKAGAVGNGFVARSCLEAGNICKAQAKTRGLKFELLDEEWPDRAALKSTADEINQLASDTGTSLVYRLLIAASHRQSNLYQAKGRNSSTAKQLKGWRAKWSKRGEKNRLEESSRDQSHH